MKLLNSLASLKKVFCVLVVSTSRARVHVQSLPLTFSSPTRPLPNPPKSMHERVHRLCAAVEVYTNAQSAHGRSCLVLRIRRGEGNEQIKPIWPGKCRPIPGAATRVLEEGRKERKGGGGRP